MPRQLRKCNETLAAIGEKVSPAYWEVDGCRKEQGRERPTRPG
jgi:hypothetical protein